MGSPSSMASQRDLALFARTRVQLQRALQDAQARGDAVLVSRLEDQLNSPPYDDAEVRKVAERHFLPSTPVVPNPSVIDKVRGRPFPTNPG